MSYSKINSEEAKEAALALAKGSYQKGLILGYEALSGATLKGKAKKYGAHYKRSAQSLLRRLHTAGLAQEQKGAHK